MRFWQTARYVLLVLAIFILVSCGNSKDNSSNTPVSQNTQAVEQNSTAIINPTLPPENPTLPPSQAINSAEVTNTSIEPQAKTGTVQILHNALGLDIVDIYLDGKLESRALERFAISKTFSLESGEHTLRIVKSIERNSEDTAQIYLEQTFSIESDDALVLIWEGSSDTSSLSIIKKNLSSLTPGQARVMFSHHVMGLPPVSMLKEQVPLTGEIAFEDSSQPIITSAEAQTFEIFSNQNTMLSGGQIEFKSGYSYIIILVGNAETETIIPIIIEDKTPPQANVRITHASPDSPNFSLSLNETVISDNIGYGETIDFQLLPAGEYKLKLIDLETSTVAKETIINLREYENVDLVIYGRDTDLDVTAFTLDSTPVEEGYLKFTVIHAVPGEGRISMGGPSGSAYRLSVQYGRSQTLKLTAETMELIFQAGNTTDPRIVEWRPDIIRIEAGKAYTYIVTGRSDGPFLMLTSDLRIIITNTSEAEVNAANLVKVRVVNAWTEPIDLTLGSRVIASGVGVEAISRTTSVIPNFYDLKLLDSNQNIIYEGEVEILANYRAFILFVMPTKQGVMVTGVPDLSGPPPSNIIRVRFIHLAPDLPKVYLEVASGEDINQEIAYGEISGTADALGGDVIFSLLDLSIRQTIKVFPTEALQGGQSYEILILPDSENDVRLKPITRGTD